jgi:hypothetical protein
MSPRAKGTGGYVPAPSREPASFTIAEMKELGDYFKKLFDDSPIRWAVYAAGAAALLDIVHLAWLAGRFIYYWLRT